MKHLVDSCSRTVEAAVFCMLALTVVTGALFTLREPAEITKLPAAEQTICMPVIKKKDLHAATSKTEQITVSVPLYAAQADTGRETEILSRGERGDSDIMEGQASWYGGEDGLDGLFTASGERFDAGAFTAAHRTLPFGTRVKVTFLLTGSSVVVRINDRGPFVSGRIIDLSRAAAAEIGLLPHGVGTVRLEILD